MLILYFHIFQRGSEVLKVICEASIYVTIVTAIDITICTIVRKFFRYVIRRLIVNI